MLPKKIIVCNTIHPFMTGGSELFTNKLVEELNRAGHNAILVTMPFILKFNKESLEKTCKPWIDLNLSKLADVVIPLRFPTWLVNHPNKVVYLNHQLRIAYDLYDKPYGPKHSEIAFEASKYVAKMDRSLANAKKIFAVSKNVQSRLKQYSGIESELLYHSLPNEELHYPGTYGDYILSVGRLVPMKRVDLLIKAMALTKTPVRCMIVGEGADRPRLEKLIEDLNVKNKVELTGWVLPERLIDLYAHSLCSFYAPVDEDYGLVTLESFKSAKPVITTQDAGGVLEFVKHDINGWVFPEDAEMFARAMDTLYLNRELACTMGKAGLESVEHINWKNCIKRLEEYF
ncbi:glycosyltransferase family 4 protein [Neobacillus massiliamazoniensis]|uniref:Alpha-D-mannose-alpha(1-6)phosphatidyl myo-inositol monomannoside transferase n=1 Tax=Neobacillus massiliamazoniensis TaxID=1499688 RepID=A0A0U1NWT9_9BACI|nr:glycosyltransferase family 4 protein [Neobacillus massiliamazoniensis]CRK82485.1 alpha-D-mannose-alpha(1-6)phosphatidyl myo-inositol monomannoside transferase [Neobacillus massiliamazoniensis]